MRLAAVLCACLWLAWMITPAIAEQRAEWKPSTFAEIQHTTEPGAVAEIVFHNDDVNSGQDNGKKPVELDGLIVELTFTWEVRQDGSDQIAAVPPDGYVAVPDTLVVKEGGTARMLIYPLIAIGF